MQENHYLVPAQLHGFEKNIQHSVLAGAIEDAEDWFVDAKERLLDVNNWKKYSADTSVGFNLADGHGNMLHRKAHKGDHIVIDNALHTIGFGRVVIEAIEYDDYPDIDMETFALRITPGADTANRKDGAALHNVTNTIVIERIGKRLSASCHARNQLNSNKNLANEMFDNAPWLGLSDAAWANLINGLID